MSSTLQSSSSSEARKIQEKNLCTKPHDNRTSAYSKVNGSFHLRSLKPNLLRNISNFYHHQKYFNHTKQPNPTLIKITQPKSRPHLFFTVCIGGHGTRFTGKGRLLLREGIPFWELSAPEARLSPMFPLADLTLLLRIDTP